jgi:lactoylglutathione lyase
MKRFHVHLHVENLTQCVGFYSKLFAAEPARLECDYAKWMLEDPPVNFAISTRGEQPGIDHLGIQTDDPAELASMKARAAAADLALLDEGKTTCCYARSEKHWVTDPQGIAWEHFHTLADIPVFNESVAQTPTGSACCAPAETAAAAIADPAACRAPTPRGRPVGIPIQSSISCCGGNPDHAGKPVS